MRCYSRGHRGNFFLFGSSGPVCFAVFDGTVPPMAPVAHKHSRSAHPPSPVPPPRPTKCCEWRLFIGGIHQIRWTNSSLCHWTTPRRAAGPHPNSPHQNIQHMHAFWQCTMFPPIRGLSFMANRCLDLKHAVAAQMNNAKRSQS